MILEEHPGIFELVLEMSNLTDPLTSVLAVAAPPSTSEPEQELGVTGHTEPASIISSGFDVPLPSPAIAIEKEECEDRTSLEEDSPMGAQLTHAAPTGPSPTIIQFSTPVYYCLEEEGTQLLEVVRLGDASKSCSVKYATVDKTAKEGEKYCGISGTLKFAPQELTKELHVEIINDERWDATLEFGVELSDAQGATLGHFLDQARVKIIDDDCFPTNKFRDECLEYAFDRIPKVPLLIEYCKMNLNYPRIRRGVLHLLIIGQLENLHCIWNFFVRLVVIDVVLESGTAEASTGKMWQLLLAGVAIIVPQCVMYYADTLKTGLRLAGQCRTILQTNILRKFLNYEENVRSTIRGSDLIMAVTHDSPELVTMGFLKFLDLAREVGLLLMLFLYQAVMCIAQGSGAGGMVAAVFPAVLFPCCMMLFVKFRLHVTLSVMMKTYEARGRLALCTQTVVENLRLIMDFSKRAPQIQRAETMIREFNNSANAARIVDDVNRNFGPLLMSLLLGFYISLGGTAVLQGSLSMGLFVTNLSVLTQACGCWNKVYSHMLTIQSALPAMEHVVRFLNLPIDLNRRRHLSNQRREMNIQERLRARETMAELKKTGQEVSQKVLYASDTIPLKLQNVSFAYRPLEGTCSSSLAKIVEASNSMSLAPELGMHNWFMSVQQGTLVALVGAHAGGKSTLLRIVGNVLLPDNGDFFTPPQLRTYYVTQQPIFTYGSLCDNLRFGLQQPDHEDGAMERVLSVCRKVGISEDIIALVEDTKVVKDWGMELSMSQRVRLHLARAFIANPEVLALEKPSLTFCDSDAGQMLSLLRDHIRKKGIDIVSSDRVMRRPRTIIFTASRPAACALADQVFRVLPNAIELVPPEEVSGLQL